MYFDSAYIAKVYIAEPDSMAVRELVATAETRVSSFWAITEVVCVFQRRHREGIFDAEACADMTSTFLKHVDEGIWRLTPVTSPLLRRTATMIAGLPPTVFIRAGDALHLATAATVGETEVWTNDRHLLAAAPYFGLKGRTVNPV